MFRLAGSRSEITSGSTLGLADTARFIELLNGLRAGLREELREFFDSAGELTVTRAAGRLDLMGGIAVYSGSLVLELPISNATHAAPRLREEKTLRAVSLGGGPPRLFEIALTLT